MVGERVAPRSGDQDGPMEWWREPDGPCAAGATRSGPPASRLNFSPPRLPDRAATRLLSLVARSARPSQTHSNVGEEHRLRSRAYEDRIDADLCPPIPDAPVSRFSHPPYRIQFAGFGGNDGTDSMVWYPTWVSPRNSPSALTKSPVGDGPVAVGRQPDASTTAATATAKAARKLALVGSGESSLMDAIHSSLNWSTYPWAT